MSGDLFAGWFVTMCVLDSFNTANTTQECNVFFNNVSQWLNTRPNLCKMSRKVEK